MPRLACNGRRRRRKGSCLLPCPDDVEVHRSAGVAEALGDHAVRVRRLVHRLECPEPDALVTAPDLGVEGPVRTCADAAVAWARAAAGASRQRGGGAARERAGGQRE
jgi:hypothetical protein